MGQFSSLALTLTVASWGLLGVSQEPWTPMTTGYVPVRALVTLVWAILIPGFATLRVLRVKARGRLESTLFATGFGTGILILAGLAANEILPMLGIESPVSRFPMVCVVTFVVVGLVSLCYLLPHSDSKPPQLYVGELLAAPSLLIYLIPILAFLGATLENDYRDNTILFAMLILVAAVPVLLATDRLIHEDMYPLALWAIATALLYHMSLISANLWGSDVFHEYNLATQVTSAGHWNPNLAFNTNAMLGTVILAPTLTILSGLPLNWIFKIVYPFFLSLVPPGLYIVFSKQLAPRPAFFSAFFFTALFTFYQELPQLPRQELAEFFLTLVMILVVEAGMPRFARSVALISFGACIVVSHYGVSYIFLGLLLAAYVLTRTRNRSAGEMAFWVVRPTFIALFITLSLAWYLFVASAANISSLALLSDRIAAGIVSDLFGTQTSQPLYLVTSGAPSPIHVLAEGLHLFSQLLIAVGLLAVVLGRVTNTIKREYLGLSASSILMLVAGFAVPFFASSLNTSRLYQLSLVFLAPYMVIGAGFVSELVARRAHQLGQLAAVQHKQAKLIAGVFLATFVLFNAGVVYQLAGDHPTSIALSSGLDAPRYGNSEILGAEWTATHVPEGPVFADGNRFQVFLAYGTPITVLSSSLPSGPPTGFVFMGTYNIQTQQFAELSYVGATVRIDYTATKPYILGKNLVFDDGGSQLWL